MSVRVVFMDFLSEIITLKKAKLKASKGLLPFEVLSERALAVRDLAKPHALREALSQPGINVIAEVKRASPSLGSIKADAKPEAFARAYERGGAAAVSVLTEEDRFKGSLDDLRAVRSAVRLPILRKDFIFDDYQLYEAAEAGADALLLIVAALDQNVLESLLRTTETVLRMDALVEVHTQEEVEIALKAGANIIGVNNRDLRTFNVSLDTSVQLIRGIPASLIAVTESGLRTRDDLTRMQSAGYRGFLIGESLMKADDPAVALRTLLS
jgi:indole-3-glycerol phosphate synthase